MVEPFDVRDGGRLDALAEGQAFVGQSGDPAAHIKESNMIDIDHGSSSDAAAARPPSTPQPPPPTEPTVLITSAHARMGAVWDNYCLKSRPCNRAIV